ncbi:MAG TPA: hypothetical protein VGL72_26720 [Bryobacteraceae bacterium]|jgi:hypothetical protein
MKKTTLVTLAGFATAAGLFAQDTVTVTRGMKEAAEAATLVAQGPIGGIISVAEPVGNVRFMTQEFSFSGKTVTNAPYSADEKTESVQTLADGNRITSTTTARVYRDSQGRTRREMTFPGPSGEPSHTIITVNDPVSGTNFTLDPESKTARQMPGLQAVARMKADMAENLSADVAKMKAEAEVKARTSGTVVGFARHSQTGSAKHEDLGADVIEGVSATGSRETSLIEAGAIGNEKPITITSERWYSPDLQMEVKSVRNDPRMGVTTHTLTNINRAEPDASLFQIPSNYTTLEQPKPGVVQRFEYHTTN